jgi:uncharacterized protein (DUF39 family)
MRKLAILAALALTAAPAYAAGGGTHTAKSSAQQQCRAERKAMGAQTFRDTYGTNKNKRNAFGKCVSHRTHQNTVDEQNAQKNASNECKAERAADPAAFQQKYGSGKNKKNALGKCVSQKAKTKTKQTEQSQVQAEESAAKQCKDERRADPAAFQQKYGTNKSKSNAFGKCVSQKAKAQEGSQQQPS